MLIVVSTPACLSSHLPTCEPKSCTVLDEVAAYTTRALHILYLGSRHLTSPAAAAAVSAAAASAASAAAAAMNVNYLYYHVAWVVSILFLI